MQRAGFADVALAAEFKRASPSKGDIAVGLDIRGEFLSIMQSVTTMGSD